MKHTLLVAAMMAVSAGANALKGTVVDENGNAIFGANIEVVGSKSEFKSDEQGMFEIPLESVDEIHIEADGYNHKVLHLHGDHDGELKIVLKKGVLEIVDVVGIPLHISAIESAQPINVLTGAELKQKQAATLGETLKNEVGVHATHFGGVSSSPVIRGLEGPRVLITQNGLDVSDASRVGPDHVVSTEASTAEQIEILRGPATLFYGSGAIGGVVNIVDDRVPRDSESKAAFLSEYNTVNQETVSSAALTGGTESLAFHVDGFARNSDDYEIPGEAVLETEEEHEEEGHEEHAEGILENSFSESYGFNVGGSVLMDNGFVGLSYGRLERTNGLPGHAHGEEEHDEEGEEGEEEHEEHEEENTFSEMEQDRIQLLSEFSLSDGFLTGINTRIGYTDYQHEEIHEEGEEEHEGEEHEEEHDEHGEGTVFKNKTSQVRVDLLHKELGNWKGAFSFEARKIDFEAVGEEAFTPPSETSEFSFSLLEEMHTGNFLWQLGARVEQVSLSADDIMLPGHEEHEEEGEEEEEHEEHEGELIVFDEFDFTPVSLSAGMVWDFTPGYNIGLSLSHSERAPSAAELFSAGPHIATQAFEAGALFEIHEEEAGEFHLEYTGEAELETSNNIDLSLRKFEGNFAFMANVFYNQISDYYSLVNTGLSTEELFPEEEHEGEEEEGEHAHAEDLPVYIFQQSDVTIYGLELEAVWQVHPNLKWTVWGDTLKAEFDDGGYLPRTSPSRVASQLNFERGAWSAELSAVNYADQENTAINETATDGYTMLDARIAYKVMANASEATVYLAGNNLLDEEARVHTSFIKDQAPLPGVNLKMGVSVRF